MKRLLWLPFVTILVFLLTGFYLTKSATPDIPESEADLRKLGLGTRGTIVIALTSDCQTCEESMDFYKQLAALPAMDRKERRLIAVAMDGVIPVDNFISAHGFKPHALTSGPYKFREIAGVSEPGTLLLLDANGNQRGKWVGRLSESQREDIIRAVTGD